MLRRIFRKTHLPVPTLPDGVRVYAVGDVHGCHAALQSLLGMIEADDRARGSADTQLIFLGDLMDRGPDSAGVIETLRTLAPDWATPRFLTGNHEELMLSAIDGKRDTLRIFVRAGGRETLLSYGMSPSEFDQLDWDELADHAARAVPADHLTFLRGFEEMIVIGDYAFVHAGIRPTAPIDAQKPSDLRWIREPFLSHRGRLSHVVVHGHTISDAVEEQPHRIGIDTGAYASGRLTAVGLEGTERWFLSTGGG